MIFSEIASMPELESVSPDPKIASSLIVSNFELVTVFDSSLPPPQEASTIVINENIHFYDTDSNTKFR
jgi:hypothetical protein